MTNPAFTYDYVSLKPDQQIGLHIQNTWELACVVRGKGHRTIGDSTAPITEGEVILIPPHIPHVWDFDPSATDADGHITNIAVFFEPSVLDRIETFFPEARQAAVRLKSLTEAVSYTGQTQRRIRRLLQAMRRLSPEYRLGKMFELMVLIADTDGCPVAGRNKNLNKAEQRLEQIRIFCACNYARNISLDEITAHTNMNKSAFCSFMRRHTGQSFSEYVNSYRLEKAAERLVQTEDNIAEIAYDTGFVNVTYFNRLFKSHFGLTPSALRKNRGI